MHVCVGYSVCMLMMSALNTHDSARCMLMVSALNTHELN